MLTPSSLNAENKAILPAAPNIVVGTAVNLDGYRELTTTCPRCKKTGKIVSEQLNGRYMAHVVGCYCAFPDGHHSRE